MRCAAQMYDGGQPCDITGEPRRTEVRYVCAEDGKDVISSIRETATCVYTLIFSTPRLCAHMGFKTPELPVHGILCVLAGAPDLAADAAATGASGDAALPVGEAAGDGLGGDGGRIGAGERASHVGEAEKDEVDIGKAAGKLSEGMKELGRALDAAARGGEVNLTALETALADAQLGHGGDEAPGQMLDGEAARLDIETLDAVAQGRAGEEQGVKAPARVGPPAASKEESEDEGFYLDDHEQQEDDEVDGAFTRSGMHAEL